MPYKAQRRRILEQKKIEPKEMFKTFKDIERGVKAAFEEEVSYQVSMKERNAKQGLNLDQLKVYKEAKKEIRDLLDELKTRGLNKKVARESLIEPEMIATIISDIAEKNNFYKKALKEAGEESEIIPMALAEKIGIDIRTDNIKFVRDTKELVKEEDSQTTRELKVELQLRQSLEPKEVEMVIKRYGEISDTLSKISRKTQAWAIHKMIGNEKGAKKVEQEIMKLNYKKHKIGLELEDLHRRRGRYRGVEVH